MILKRTLTKLMINALFGKTMENLRNRFDIKLMRTSGEDEVETHIAKPSSVRSEMFNEDLVGLQRKTKVEWNKPTDVGVVC